VVFCSEYGPVVMYTGCRDTRIKNFDVLMRVLKCARSKQLFLGLVSLSYAEVLKGTEGRKVMEQRGCIC